MQRQKYKTKERASSHGIKEKKYKTDDNKTNN